MMHDIMITSSRVEGCGVVTDLCAIVIVQVDVFQVLWLVAGDLWLSFLILTSRRVRGFWLFIDTVFIVFILQCHV